MIGNIGNIAGAASKYVNKLTTKPQPAAPPPGQVSALGSIGSAAGGISTKPATMQGAGTDDPYGFQSVLPQGTTVKMLQDNALAKQAEDSKQKFGFGGVSQASDPLTAFLNKGIQETPDQLKSRYGELFDAGNFGFGGGKSLGMDGATTSALNNKLKSNLTSKLGNARSGLLNNASTDFAQRQSTYQNLADANVRRVMGIEAQSAAAREAAKQKKSALTGALLGVGGAGALVGGPAGAQVGAGVGTGLGGLF